MIILDSINKTLRVALDVAATTGQLAWTSSWVDITSTGFVPGCADGLTQDLTPVNIIQAPPLNTSRQVKGFTVFNTDTVSALLHLTFLNVGDVRKMHDIVLNPSESVSFNGEDIKVHMSDGTVKIGTVIDNILNSQVGGVADVYPLLSPQVGGSTAPLADAALRWNPAEKELYIGQLAMATLSAIPLPPTTDVVVMFTKKLASRNMPAFIGPNGLDTTIQPLLARNKIGYWNPSGNSATVPPVFGFLALTAVGTATARNVATTNLLTRMRRLAYVSAATAGSLCGGYQPSAQYTTGNGLAGNNAMGGFFFVGRIGTSDAAAVTGARAFIGLSSSVAAPTNVEPNTLTNSIGLAQISTDNTQWYLVYGGSAAQTAIPLGTVLGAPTVTTTCYELSLFSPPSLDGVINYMVTNLFTGVSVAGTITPTILGTQTPANTTLLAVRAWRTNNATALAVGLDICSFYTETDN